jgi:hypothetical protein
MHTYYYIFWSLLCCFFLSSCDSEIGSNDPKTLREGYKVIPSDSPRGKQGNWTSSVWITKGIYYSYPLWHLTIDNNLNVLTDEEVSEEDGIWMSASPDGEKILLVDTKQTGVSLGNLLEIDAQSKEVSELLDVSHKVSSAHFLTIDTVIFYSYGWGSNPAGFYLFEKKNAGISLLMEELNPRPVDEVIHSFDIDRNKRLLYTTQGYYKKEIVLISIQLDTKMVDTVIRSFEIPEVLEAHWLALSPDGTKLLINHYPSSALLNESAYRSITQIYDFTRKSMSIFELDPRTYWVVSIYPRWSPDGTKVCFSGGEMSEFGPVGSYYLYIKKVL